MTTGSPGGVAGTVPVRGRRASSARERKVTDGVQRWVFPVGMSISVYIIFIMNLHEIT